MVHNNQTPDLWPTSLLEHHLIEIHGAQHAWHFNPGLGLSNPLQRPIIMDMHEVTGNFYQDRVQNNLSGFHDGMFWETQIKWY